MEGISCAQLSGLVQEPKREAVGYHPAASARIGRQNMKLHQESGHEVNALNCFFLRLLLGIATTIWRGVRWQRRHRCEGGARRCLFGFRSCLTPVLGVDDLLFDQVRIGISRIGRSGSKIVR